MRVLVVEAPESAVSLSDAKLHLRVTSATEDALITTFIGAATQNIDGPDGWLGRAIAPQTLELQCALPRGPVRLPLPPVVSLESVKYLDANGVEQTADLDDFYLTGAEGNILTPSSDTPAWAGGSLRPDALRVRYQAGYVADPEADPLVAAIPEPIKAAILLMVGDLYQSRETFVTGRSVAAVPMSLTVERLLAPYRIYS